MKNILCYGDSNTWGFVAGSFNFDTLYMERYPRHMRWTGILQQLLGEDYYIIEEGLNGRTTNVDYKELSGRNGKTYLLPCLYTHAPLDLVIICLGINDFKQEFNRNSEDVVQGLSELIEIIQTSKYGTGMQSSPPILLVIPPKINREDGFADQFTGVFSRSKNFNQACKFLADKTGCLYLDASRDIDFSSVDGIHLNEDGHKKMAKLIQAKIGEIWCSINPRDIT